MKIATPKDTKRSVPSRDVDGYLAPLPKETRVTLEKLRKAIRAAAPKAEETISYRIPTYKQHGPLVFFAAFKNHCSLFVVSKSLIKTFGSELAAYDTSGTTIHFSAKNPLPATLVKKIVKARIAENRRRADEQNAEKSTTNRGKKHRTCSRGHAYQGSGPCPSCWPGHRKRLDARKK